MLTASDLNGEFNNILGNGLAVVSPLTGDLDMDGNDIVLDADADTGIVAITDDRIDLFLTNTTLFRFNTVASAVNGVDFFASATGNAVSFVPFGTDANIALTISGKGTGHVTLGQATSTGVRFAADQPISDSSGNEFIAFAKTASAVNEITVTNAATGTAPIIAASGETNVSLNLRAKGTGTMTLRGDTVTLQDSSSNELLVVGPTVASAVNEVTVTNAATGVAPAISASGEANVSLDVRPKGTGTVRITDGTDLTKKIALNVAGVTTGTTRVFTAQDKNGILALDADFAYSNVAGSPGRVPLPTASIFGLEISNNAVDAVNDIDIAAGAARDSTDAANLILASALIKRIDASWVVGTNQGGLDGTESVAGTPDNDTWYYVWIIQRSDTGVVDTLFSESSTAPTMPTNYDRKRLIGVVRRGTATNLQFYQDEGWFRWQAEIIVLNAGTATTDTAVTLTSAVPPISKAFEANARIFVEVNTSNVFTFNRCFIRVAAGVDHTSFRAEIGVGNFNNQGKLNAESAKTFPNTGTFTYRNSTTNALSHTSTIAILGFKITR